MAFHHARHEEQPRGINHLAARLRHLARHARDRSHPVSLDEHIAVEWRAASRVPDSRPDDHGFAHISPLRERKNAPAYVTIDPSRCVRSGMTWVAQRLVPSRTALHPLS